MDNNSTIIVSIPRGVPNGGINPNVRKPYANMEECLEKYLTEQRSTGYVPLYKCCSYNNIINIATYPTICGDVVGKVVAMTDTSATVEITNKDYFMSLSDPIVDIHVTAYNMAYTDPSIVIDKVIGICLSNRLG